MPAVNSPRTTSSTPTMSTAALASDEMSEGTRPRYWLRRAYLTAWVFAAAWYPAQRRKNPPSAPEALSVSTMLMPAMVQPTRLAWSRI